MRESCRYSLMSLVYSSSVFCGWAAVAADAGAALVFLAWARATGTAGPDARASAKSPLLAAAYPNLIEQYPPTGLRSDTSFRGRLSMGVCRDGRRRRIVNWPRLVRASGWVGEESAMDAECRFVWNAGTMSLRNEKSRLKAGCSQDWPPHKVSALRLCYYAGNWELR